MKTHSSVTSPLRPHTVAGHETLERLLKIDFATDLKQKKYEDYHPIRTGPGTYCIIMTW